MASALRNFAAGFFAVMLGGYLASLGLGSGAVGFIFTAAMAGGAAFTLAFAAFADRGGRRLTLMIAAGLMTLGGVVFLLTDHYYVLVVAAVFGLVNPAGANIGPQLVVEQAALPQTTPEAKRTGGFVAYNFANQLALAIGSLVVAVPSILGVSTGAGYRALLGLYVLIALLSLISYTRLSRDVEVDSLTVQRMPLRSGLGLHRSRATVAKLAILNAVDSFAGNSVIQGIASYWFFLRFDTDLSGLAAIFFGANILAVVSMLSVSAIANRFGLVNTIVFTHVPANLLLLLVPLMPNVQLAAAVWIARHLFSHLDVPARQSFMMSIVALDERSATAGVTQVARSAAAAVAPAFAGMALAVPTLGLPFLIAGSLKLCYDATFYALFRNEQPETSPQESDP